MNFKKKISKLADAPPAIILGGGITALGTLRSLAKAGIRAFNICEPKVAENYSRWYGRPAGMSVLLKEEGDLAGFLTNLPFEKAVLLPCTDHWSSKVAALDPAFRERFPASISPAGVQNCFTDKARFRELLEKYQVPHPRTLYLDKNDTLEWLNDDECPYFFLKPCDSQSFVSSFQVKGLWPRNKADCLEKLHSMRQHGFDMVLQEYVPGPPDRHFYVEGFINRHGEHSATFGRQRIRMNPPDFGNTTFMRSVEFSRVRAAAGSLFPLLRAVKYRGIYSAEFKYDERDGKFKVLEVNARPWWYIELAMRCGMNLAALSYLDALELDVPFIPEYEVGKTCVNFLSDFSQWRTEWCTDPRISLLGWVWQWAGAMPSVLAYDDPLPGIVWVANRLRGRFARAANPIFQQTALP